MPVSYLDVSLDMFVMFCNGLKRPGDKSGYYKVISDGLPDDAKVISATVIGPPGSSTIRIAIVSQSFTEGEILPDIKFMSVSLPSSIFES